MTNDSRLLTLFDFREPRGAAGWVTANDDVIGGVSESEFLHDKEGFCRFCGIVSLEHYGGFASVRTKPLESSLEGYAGVLFLARGDGKKYRFKVSSGELFEGITHQADFTAAKDRWQEYRIAFDDCRPTLRGKTLLGEPPVSSGIIRQIGFMISDGQEGAFRLDIQWVRAFR